MGRTQQKAEGMRSERRGEGLVFAEEWGGSLLCRSRRKRELCRCKCAHGFGMGRQRDPFLIVLILPVKESPLRMEGEDVSSGRGSEDLRESGSGDGQKPSRLHSQNHRSLCEDSAVALSAGGGW